MSGWWARVGLMKVQGVQSARIHNYINIGYGYTGSGRWRHFERDDAEMKRRKREAQLQQQRQQQQHGWTHTSTGRSRSGVDRDRTRTESRTSRPASRPGAADQSTSNCHARRWKLITASPQLDSATNYSQRADYTGTTA